MYFNSTEVAVYLKKSKSSIYKWCSSNEIPYYKKGKNLLFNKDLIDKWLEQYNVPTKDQVSTNISKLLKQKI